MRPQTCTRHVGRIAVLLLLFFFSINQTISAQNRANHWYYRGGEGIDFNNSTPTLLQNGATTYAEGTAAISDTSGNLQFYTDGVTVWNRLHQAMPNGQNLLGDRSSTQSALIVPQPDAPDLYYVFTTAQTCGADGFRYSIVDMSLDGGNGDVQASAKNIPLLTHSLEKIAGVHHCNGKDIWIMAIEATSGNFHAWLLTNEGLCVCPVVSTTNNPNLRPFGCMKFSNNGKRLLVTESIGGCNPGRVHTDLYDFDNNTGAVTFYQQIDTGIVNISSSGGQFWGASFSPNNQVLYLSTGFTKYNGSGGVSQSTAVVQYDLNASNIESSAVLLFDNATTAGGCGSPMGSLQLAPDGKIYVGNTCSTNGLHVIEDPNILGTGCNYQSGANWSANATGSGYGITNFVESYFGEGVSACDQVLDTNMCNWITEVHCPLLDREDELEPQGLSIYPHPLRDKSKVQFNYVPGETYTLEILDLQGKVIAWKSQVQGSPVSLEKGDWESGLYFLKLSNGTNSWVEKILVQD